MNYIMPISESNKTTSNVMWFIHEDCHKIKDNLFFIYDYMKHFTFFAVELYFCVS